MATRSAQHFVEWTKIRTDILWHHASKWLSDLVQTESLKTEASPPISSCWQMKLRAARTRIKSIRPTEVTLIFSWGNLRINFLSRFDNWTWSLNARNLGWNPIFGNRFQPFVIGLICLLRLTLILEFSVYCQFYGSSGGFFMTTGFPIEYPANTDCQWYIFSAQNDPILVSTSDRL